MWRSKGGRAPAPARGSTEASAEASWTSAYLTLLHSMRTASQGPEREDQGHSARWSWNQKVLALDLESAHCPRPPFPLLRSHCKAETPLHVLIGPGRIHVHPGLVPAATEEQVPRQQCDTDPHPLLNTETAGNEVATAQASVLSKSSAEGCPGLPQPAPTAWGSHLGQKGAQTDGRPGGNHRV